MSKSTLDVLKGARDLLSDPDRWTASGQYAVGADGYTPADPREGNARAFCALGACSRVGWFDLLTFADEEGGLAREIRAALREVAGENVIDFNDTHSHAEVLALFDKAIAAEEAKRGYDKHESADSPENKSVITQPTPRRRENAGCEREAVVA